jgi:hypothetical protein
LLFNAKARSRKDAKGQSISLAPLRPCAFASNSKAAYAAVRAAIRAGKMGEPFFRGAHMKAQLTLRDFFWLVLVAAILICWGADRDGEFRRVFDWIGNLIAIPIH